MNFSEKYSKPLKKPPGLVPGDTIGVAAPASPFDHTVFEKGLLVLESLGFDLFVPDEIFQHDGYLAGSDQTRADQLLRLMTDPQIKGIIAARGGFGSMKLLPLLDYDIIAPVPKVFIGFSDITALLFNWVEKCGWVVFHGPTVTTLGNADPESIDGLRLAVMGNRPVTLVSKGNTIIPGIAAGPIMAGNLTTLCHLVGTPYMPNLKGCILLIEERGEVPYRIDRMLTHMKMAGSLDQLAGLALGSFTECGALFTIENLVSKLFHDQGIPILSGFEVGHDQRNLTLPIGLDATLDTDKHRLVLHAVATC
jgi:muramoyltetrapeptide carboxypeptidase